MAARCSSANAMESIQSALGGGGRISAQRPVAARQLPAEARAARRRITFNVRVKVNRPAEWAEMFGDAWRTMKYRFYDPRCTEWIGTRPRRSTSRWSSSSAIRQELLNIINEMIGELNASHTGAAPPPRGFGGAAGTGNLGIELEPDKVAGRYKVTYIYESGPADKDWVKVNVGDYLIAIGGKEVKSGDEYWELLNDRLNRKLEVTFNNKPTAEGAWKTRIEAINANAYATLRYDRWVKERRQKVDELSNWSRGLPAHTCDGSTFTAQVRKRDSRVPQQGRDDHRSALERRRQHRTGIARDSLCSGNIRFGCRAGLKRQAGRSPATSDQRSCCKIGARLQTPRCFRRASRRWAWARRSARRRWAR
jgi:hypothetical protein